MNFISASIIYIILIIIGILMKKTKNISFLAGSEFIKGNDSIDKNSVSKVSGNGIVAIGVLDLLVIIFSILIENIFKLTIPDKIIKTIIMIITFTMCVLIIYKLNFKNSL